ncbi:MAG: gamma-glutamyltransferase, partial [Polyangiaceae bacterium]
MSRSGLAGTIASPSGLAVGKVGDDDQADDRADCLDGRCPVQGVIAAGSAPTADAGAEVLDEGGNAVDAAVAACFATAVGEPTLTSLAGGGMMIHRVGATGKVTICDFFSDAPRMGLRDLKEPDFFAIDLDFGPTTQQFHIGAASAAVPGVIPGLCEALDKWGTKPLAEVVAPACRMLREGYHQGPYQGFAA